MKFLSSFSSGRPVLIDPNQIGAISDIALRDMFEGAEELAVIELASMSYREDDEGFYYNQETGIAVIPILGVLMNRMSWSYGFATGYDYIRSAFNAAMARSEVKGIVFDVNSPGGQAAGNFELASEIAEARGRKPMMAIVNSMAASGGYSLATAADRIVAMPSAAIGSIGVVSTHVSFEKNLEKAGIEVTFIYAGKHKVDGNPYQSLPKSVKSSMLASVERIYDNFVSVVANNRGIDAQDVRDTEAAMYDSEEALARGLIDAIQTPSEAMASFISGLSSPTIRKTVMTAKHNSEGAEVTVTPIAAAPVVAAPVEAAPVAAAEVAAPVVAAAPAVDQKARIKTILTSAEAAGRTELAEHLAYETDMAADAVVALLSKAPKAEAKQANDFVKVMDSIEHPNVGGGEVGSGEKELSVSDRIIRNFKVVTGRK